MHRFARVLEEKGPIEAVKRSWALTSGSFWVTLGRVILINVVVGFIAGLIVQVIGIIAAIVMFTILGDPSDPSNVWSTIILYGVISALQMLAYSLVVPHPGGVPDPHVRGREDPQGEFRAPPRPRKPGLDGVGCVRVRSSPDARRGRGSVVAERRTRALRLQHRFERF